MNLKFLHVSDAHLGFENFYLADRAGDRRQEFRRAFRDAVEYALEAAHEIDGMLIAGDLFEHHRPDEDLWSFTKGLLSRLLAQHKLVAMVPGHHDSYAYKNSVYRTERLPGVDLFLNTSPEAPRVHEIRGARVFLYGLAFVPGQTPVPLPRLERLPEKGAHIGILHGFVAGHPDFTGAPHQLRLDLDTLGASELDYIALGGCHGFTEYKTGATTVAYSGSLEGRGFEPSELGDKGPLIVSIDDDGVHIERLINNRKRIESYDLDLRSEQIDDATALVNALRARSGRDVIARVTLTGTAEFVADLDAIHQEVRDSFHHLEIRDRSRIVDSALLDKIEAENTIRGYFVRKLGERIATTRKRVAKNPDDSAGIRELEVLERAMKLGVEQFIEDEAPADSIYSLIPDDASLINEDEVRAQVGVGHLEDRVKAMLARRRNEDEARTPSNGISGAATRGERVAEEDQR